MDWSTALRAELTKRATDHRKQSGVPGYLSLGATPTCLFEPFENGTRHGNFLDATYKAICGDPAWWPRTNKTHTRMDALPPGKREGARELDSCNSSDALLMNCFCYPGGAERILAATLPSLSYSSPKFGVPGEVALIGGGRDATEIDMQIGEAIFESKLTEHDFTSQSKAHVEKYARFKEVFHISALPQTDDKYTHTS